MNDFGLVALFSLALLPGAEVNDEAAPQRPPLVSRPSWLVPPTPRDGEYPQFASALALPGVVTVNCLSLTNGQLSDCKVVSAFPAQIGFEPIALNIAQRGSMNPGRDAFGSRESRVEFRINFSTDQFDRGRRWTNAEPNAAQIAAARPVALRMLEQADFSPTGFGLEDLPPNLRPRIAEWVVEITKQPSMQDGIVLALARVMAKNGVSEFPEKQPANWAEWEKDFFLALEDQDLNNRPFDQLRQKFCHIHACTPP